MGEPDPAPDLRRRFGLAWSFLLAATLIGCGLRLQIVRPWTTLDSRHLLHTHSHVAFLGWVFNAFFVVALRHFIPADERPSYDRLWWTMQIAVLGMLVTFPFQGYGAGSIACSTVHMLASVIFAVKLWRRNQASRAAKAHLRAALCFMLLSGLGPLAIGPLASAGLRDSPAYTLAIYFYLHCQYNGWFLFFLQALLLQRAHEHAWPVREHTAVRAAGWLFAGNLLTYALSALWCDPPAWIRGVALLGGVLELVGCVEFARATASFRLPSNWPGKPLAAFAVTGWILKHGLHFLAPWPGGVELVQQRYVAIAFLHLVFLGVVIPTMVVWALGQGWLRDSFIVGCGVVLFLVGAVATECLLVAPTLVDAIGGSFSWPLPMLLLAAAIMLTIGIGLMGNISRQGTRR